MTQTLTTAGYIVTAADLIHGFGPTIEAAQADARQTFASAGIDLLPDDADTTEQLGSWMLESRLETVPATQGLLDMVEAIGGDCGWYMRDGIACTRDEEEG